MTEHRNNARGTQTADPELAALARIDRLLVTLPPAARLRILGYLADRHGLAAPPAPGGGRGGDAPGAAAP
jgi:hypothetical protein